MSKRYMVVAIRPDFREGKADDWASAGSIWPTIAACENHVAYCEVMAERRGDTDVRYAIAELIEVAS